MRKWFCTLFAVAVAVSGLLALQPAAASAATATEVYVNGVLLDGRAPYLTLGGAAASLSQPETGGYAVFDASSGTLRLSDMRLDAVYGVSEQTRSLVYADGDLTVELAGSNTLQYAQSGLFELVGIYTSGALTVSGDGSAEIDLSNAYLSDETRVTAMFCGDTLLVQGGGVKISVHSRRLAYGLYAENDVTVAGGTLQMDVQGASAFAVYAANGDCTLTGGVVAAVAQATGTADEAVGLYAQSVALSGGQASFQASGSVNESVGLTARAGLAVTGGQLRLIGETQAAQDFSGNAVTVGSEIPVYVSETAAETDKRLWDANTDAALAGAEGTPSPFRFVQFGEFAAAETPPADGQEEAQTSEGHSPGYWVGVGLLALIFGIMLGGYTRKKR